MKTLKSILLLLALFLSIGCEEFIGGDLNKDPNNPVDVPIYAQLPAIEIALVDLYGGNFSRLCGMLVQQVEGLARACSANNQYTGLNPVTYNTPWNDVYENILNEVKIAKAKANQEGLSHYLGILNTIEAYTLMMATDVWDDMPYSAAFQGIDNLNPEYDSQSDIYNTIYDLLDEALVLFDGLSGSVTPGSDDIYHGGNIDFWKKAAHAIKARGLLHQKQYAASMSEAMNAFTSPAENLGFHYPDEEDAAQWYRFNRDRTGDIEFHPTMRGMMTEMNDTSRLAVIDKIFTPSQNRYLKADFFQELITYRETQFIIAEADVQAIAGGTEQGYTAYLEGIKASFARMGVAEEAYQTYISQNSVNPGIGNLSLAHVMTEKYIAMYLLPEAYSDFRRTGIPALIPVSGRTIPVRWHYGSDEYQFNSNAPAVGDINIFEDKVGWDRD